MWDKFILGNSEQTAKIFKTGFAKIRHTAVFKTQLVGFRSTTTDYDEFESWEKKLLRIVAQTCFTRTSPLRL